MSQGEDGVPGTGGATTTKAVRLEKTIESISLWRGMLDRADARLGRLEDIFTEHKLIHTRRGERAFAERCIDLIDDHVLGVSQMIHSRLSREEVTRLIRHGLDILDKAGRSGPLNPMVVLVSSTAQAGSLKLRNAQAGVLGSAAYAMRDKMLADVVSDEIGLSETRRFFNSQLRTYTLTKIFHPVLRREKVAAEEMRIAEALRIFGDGDAAAGTSDQVQTD